MESKNDDNESIIKQMFNYASQEHQQYLHRQAFEDISNVFLDFIKQPHSKKNPTRWVCNAPMGHGKKK